ncbi:MAG: hypothetical protein AB7E80_13790, partial [Hyphomicrobiaceae bacterium]
MRLHRAILSVLLAVAIVFAPMGAAWAGGAKGVDVAMSPTAAHTIEGENSVAVSPMEDCASMMKGAA